MIIQPDILIWMLSSAVACVFGLAAIYGRRV